MSNKAQASRTIENAMPVASRRGAAVASHGFPALQPSYPLEGALGNQALAQLLQTGVLQAKLRVSQPGDPDEQEADRVANQVVAASHESKIQRKCACAGSGSPCPKCDEEEAATIHRRIASPLLRSSHLGLQRSPAGDGPTNSPEQTNPPKPSPTPAHSHPLVVEDDAKSAAPHQMHKSAFIALLRSDACATADAVLASVGHTTKSCPYIEKWLAFYEKQSSDHIERAILKYAPETATARSAHEAIRLVVMRVQRAALTWAKTGKVSGLPEDLASQLPGQGFLGAVHSFASSSVGGAILGFLGGSKPEKSTTPDTAAEKSPTATISRKASNTGNGAGIAHNASAVRSQLGSGHSLDSRVQSQMSSALGHDFSHVRVHTDERGSALSSNLNARAFTIGSDVAFASGEYRPGTPVGDALIAHELAHVVQQSGVAHSSSPMHKAAETSSATTESASSQLENDADLSAVGAVSSIWAGAKRGLADIRANAIPRLRSGLRLQRCAHKDASPVKGPASTTSGAPSAQPQQRAAATNCATPDAATWQTQVQSATKDPALAPTAMSPLVEQALCPLGIQVHIAGTSNQRAEDPADYAEWQGGRVVNFDPQLNKKTRWAGYNRDRSLRVGDPLTANAAHNFNHGSRGWVVLGPKVLDGSTPLTIRQYAQHELFMLSRNLTPGINESRADTEVATWTHDFVTYFHQWVQAFPTGPRPRWERLIEYYEDPQNRSSEATRRTGNVTQQARDAAIAALVAYYRTPPVPPDKRDEFNRAFAAWMNKEHGRLVDDLDNVLHLRTQARSNP